MAGVRAAGRRRGAHRGGRHRRRLAAPRLRPRRRSRSASSTATASSRTPRSTRAAGPTPRSTRPTADAASGRRCRTGPVPSPRATAARSSGQPVPGRLPWRAAARLPRLPRALDLVGPRAAGRAGDRPRSPFRRATPSASRATRPTCEPTWTVNEDAFLEWSDRERATFEEWAAERRRGGPATSRGSCASWSTRTTRSSAWPFVVVLERLRLRRQARGAPRRARPGAGPGAARRRLRGGPRTRWGAVRARRPTPAPARSVSTRRSACRSRRCGATGPRT